MAFDVDFSSEGFVLIRKLSPSLGSKMTSLPLEQSSEMTTRPSG